MHSGDYRGNSRLFLQPQNGTNLRSPGYVPGRIVPLRPPPLPKTQASAKFNSAGQEPHAIFGISRDEQNHHAQVIRRRRHKNTLICFGISSLSFFIILAIVLGISSKFAPDGEFIVYLLCWILCVWTYLYFFKLLKEVHFGQFLDSSEGLDHPHWRFVPPADRCQQNKTARGKL